MDGVSLTLLFSPMPTNDPSYKASFYMHSEFVFPAEEPLVSVPAEAPRFYSPRECGERGSLSNLNAHIEIFLTSIPGAAAAARRKQQEEAIAKLAKLAEAVILDQRQHQQK